MSAVSEGKNSQGSIPERCELVIENPCFNNRFHPDDSISIKSFTTDYQELVKKSIAQNKNENNEFLKSFGSNQSRFKNMPAAHLACSVGSIDQIKKLVEKDRSDPMKADINGYYPLHYAVIHNQTQVVRLLLNSYCCQPNIFDKNMNTPLHFAAQLGHTEVVELLIAHPDIDLISRNNDGKTCLNLCEEDPRPNWKICSDLIKTKLKHPFRQIRVHLMDGSDIYLDLQSGSNTTVKQLETQIFNKLNFDEEHSKFFSLWICSKHLKLQFKPEHRPLQHLADWKRCIVPQLTNYDPILEEPSLILMRDAGCILKDEKKVSNPIAIRLLSFESYHNYIHSMYSCSDQDVLTLAVIFMKIVNETFRSNEWKQFFTSHLRNLKIFVPIKHFFQKPAQEWIKSILIKWEKISPQLNSLNQPKLHLLFLKHCWNFSNYGSVFFRAAVPVKDNKFESFHVCVNGSGIYLLNRQTRNLESFHAYQDIIWKVHYSPDSVEIFSKRTRQNIFLYTKQNNIINHLMYKLEAQPK